MRGLPLLFLLACPALAADTRELLALSAAAEAAGDAAKAYELAAQAAKAAPTDAAARARAASAALAAGRPAEAEAEATAALTLGAPTPALYQARAAALTALGRPREAVADADAALALNPASAASRLRRAQAREALGDGRGALDDYRRAAEMDAALAPVFERALARLSRRRLPSGWPWAAGAVLLALGVALSTRKRGRSKRVRFGAVIRVPPLGDQLANGQVLAGRYIVGRALDRGSSLQQVYEGRDLEDRPLLIRRFLPVLEARRGFQLASAQAAAALKRPGLVPLEAAFEEGGSGFVVEVPSSPSLLAALDKASGRRLPADAVARQSRALCEALDAAHAAGLVHGRLSAHEITAEPDGWRLAGLGLPGVAHPEYAPPEGDEPTKEADLYALGVCLYEALAGEKPFAGAEGPLAKREGRPASLSGRVGLPQGLDAFFSRALQPDPARRFKTALEVHGALKSLVSPAVQ